VTDAAADDEQVPDSMVERELSPDIKNNADSIEQPPCDKPAHARGRDTGDHLFKRDDTQPTHENIG